MFTFGPNLVAELDDLAADQSGTGNSGDFLHKKPISRELLKKNQKSGTNNGKIGQIIEQNFAKKLTKSRKIGQLGRLNQNFGKKTKKL